MVECVAAVFMDYGTPAFPDFFRDRVDVAVDWARRVLSKDPQHPVVIRSFHEKMRSIVHSGA
jgi:hypothetical protein